MRTVMDHAFSMMRSGNINLAEIKVGKKFMYFSPFRRPSIAVLRTLFIQRTMTLGQVSELNTFKYICIDTK